MAESYSDLGVVFNHPSIISTIVNNETIFTTTSGNRPFFYVIASERGEDNKIKLVSSVTEYLFNYGEPNLKLYGQAPYNILNILQNGESVYVLRVMPDNAGFSHAMLNIQTKVSGTKRVLDIDNNLVEIDNVILRPTTNYSRVNNASESLLDFELSSSNRNTIDGYRNNVLFYIIPKGRGKYYDKFGFRIYLNKSYDDTYDFRVYNFEVIMFDEYNNPSIVEGPFYVSLDPDALTASNESMFIEDIINRYSTYFKIKFNEDAYDYITTLINPEVTPSHLDILSGITKETIDGKETFFDDITHKDQDVHYRIHRYNEDGTPLTDGLNPLLTLVSSSDETESSIISIDNSVRNEIYIREVYHLENMKQAIANIYNDTYINNMNKVGATKTDPTGKFQVFEDTSAIAKAYRAMCDEYEEFKDNTKNFDGDKSEANFIRAFASSTELGRKLDDYLDDFNLLTDYSKVIVNDSSTLELTTTANSIYDILDTKEIISVKVTSYKKEINDMISKVINTKTIQNIDDETTELKILLSDVDKIFDYFKSVLGYDINQDLEDAIDLYNECIDLINEIESEFMPITSKEEFLVELYDNVDNILSKGLVICNSIQLNNDLDAYKRLFETSGYITTSYEFLATVVSNSVSEYNDYKNNNHIKDEALKIAKEIAATQQDITNNAKNNIYTTQLQDFSVPIQFKYGTDGDLETDNTKLRNRTLINLYIKGYKGTIDDSITSKKIIPARFILDANYPPDVKNAMHQLATEIRNDIFFYCDLGLTVSPEDALIQRDTIANFSSVMIAIYAQDFTVYDEYTGRDIKVTTPYILASKIPYCSRQFGLHYPIAGNKRGVIDGFKNISWVPNETYKELLYNKKVNYVESDNAKTRFGSNLTCEYRNTPLSNINNVITVIDIKNDVELIAENYQFEFNNQSTIDKFQNELTDYLRKYLNSEAAERLTCNVYSSDYDKLQKIIRVSITIKFYDIIERILINLDVVKK